MFASKLKTQLAKEPFEWLVAVLASQETAAKAD